MKLLGIEMSMEEFDYLISEQNKGKELKVVEGKVVAVDYKPTEEELKQQRIAELKQLLADTDYKAIKYGEGLLTDEQYAETKAQRQAWRDEINELEQNDNTKQE